MQIISNEDNLAIKYLDKINNFKKNISEQPFILLVRPEKQIYEDKLKQNSFVNKIEEIIVTGLKILEIPWEDNDNWLNLMQRLRSKFPNIQLGSSTILNKKSIDDSLNIGLNFSMMRFWDKDLFNYSKEKQFLLIPGLKQLNQLNEAIACNCKIIKIYPVKEKERILDINDFKKITFICAGDLSIKDLEKYKSFRYNAIIIGQKGFDGKSFDPNIFKYLKSLYN
mgnify:CR=1 FL=1